MPLHASTNSGQVDYNAYFAREGDSRDRSQPFAKSTVIGKVSLLEFCTGQLFVSKSILQVYIHTH